MKNLKNLLPLFAILLGVGLVFVQSAFTPKKVNTIWVYEGDDLSEVKFAEAYHIDEEAPSCPGGDLPCKITSAGTSTDPEVLQAYLNGFEDPEDVVAIADGTRN